jgi:cell wall-associated NlpC family hydrolase
LATEDPNKIFNKPPVNSDTIEDEKNVNPGSFYDSTNPDETSENEDDSDDDNNQNNNSRRNNSDEDEDEEEDENEDSEDTEDDTEETEDQSGDDSEPQEEGDQPAEDEEPLESDAEGGENTNAKTPEGVGAEGAEGVEGAEAAEAGAEAAELGEAGAVGAEAAAGAIGAEAAVGAEAGAAVGGAALTSEIWVPLLVIAGIIAIIIVIVIFVGIMSTSSGTNLASVVPPTSTGASQSVIAMAKSQLGVPYVYGGCHVDYKNYPPPKGCQADGKYDCSGFVAWSWYWGTAGKVNFNNMGGTTAQAECDSSGVTRTDVPDGKTTIPSAQIGDMICFGSSPSNIVHITLYLGNNEMIAAPHTGDVVKIEPVYWMADEHPIYYARPKGY